MSNFFIALATAISSTDDSYRSDYITNGIGTTYWAFYLMNISSGWQVPIDTDTTNAVMASMTEGGAGMAAYWQSQFQVDTQAKDSQTSVWENMIKTDQTMIDNISDARTANFKLAQGLAATSAQCINLLGLL
jgi:hypothetical protein